MKVWLHSTDPWTSVPEKLRDAAELLQRFYPKHEWVVVSFRKSRNGEPRDGTHAKGVSLDVGPLTPDGHIKDIAGRSMRLGLYIPPLAALATYLKRTGHQGVMFAAENDHFHLQLLADPSAPSRVVGLLQPKPALYTGDGKRELVMDYARLFTPKGYAIPVVIKTDDKGGALIQRRGLHPPSEG